MGRFGSDFLKFEFFLILFLLLNSPHRYRNQEASLNQATSTANDSEIVE